MTTSRTLRRYLHALVGRDHRGLLEVRARDRHGMTQTFYDPRRLDAAAAAIMQLAARTDVYVGCAPRHSRSGTRDAIRLVWALWADCDTVAATMALHAFTPAPAIIIRSGTSERIHAYWLLKRPVAADAAAAANRRIAVALGADRGAVTAATAILRPPGTLNHKHDPPRPVLAERVSAWQRVNIDEVINGLSDFAEQPPASHSPSGRRERLRRDPDALLQIAPAMYVQALTGRAPGRDGKVCCPLHEDKTPSMHVYPEPAQGWFCFGCQRGGSIFDLAAALWGLQPRGRDFIKLRTRLEETLDVHTTSTSSRVSDR